MKQPSLKATLGIIIVLGCSTRTTLATNRPHAANASMLEASAGVIGEVVAVSNDSRTYLLTVKTESGVTVSIVVDEATQVKRLPDGERSIETAQAIAADDIALGDRVYARGAHPDDSRTGRARQLIVMTRIGAISGQQVAGSLRGQVTDQMGAAITGATLLLIRKDGAERSSVTNSRGGYLLDGLASGSYTLRLAVAGFAPYENDRINIQPGNRQTIDVTLQATAREE